MIVGICGGSGSGKTTLLKKLSVSFGALKPSVFSMDNYYLPKHLQQKDKNGEVNFDLPTSLDRERLMNDLVKLKQGESVKLKEYNFNTNPNQAKAISILPSDLILVEGLFLFEYEELSDLLDFSVFVDIAPNIQLNRRVQRDEKSRGYDNKSILYQWENHVLPCYKKHIEPFKEKANFIFHSDDRSEDDFKDLVKQLNLALTI